MVKDYQTLEQERKKALVSQDALTYARLCIEMGIKEENIEDPYLFELGGIKPAGLEDSLTRSLKKQASIDEFIEKAGSLNIQNIGADPESKRFLLEKYFSKFAPGGEQDISDYNDAAVGKLFKGIYSGYLKQKSRK